MDGKVRAFAKKLLNTGYDDLSEREQRILRRMANRLFVTENIITQFHEKLTLGQRPVDQVAAFGSSWTFIIKQHYLEALSLLIA